VNEALAEAAAGDRSLVDSLTIVGFPFVIAGGAYIIDGAFQDEAHAVVWFLACFVATVLLMRRSDGEELMRRLAEWMAPRDRER
jgi:hypothetical protein